MLFVAYTVLGTLDRNLLTFESFLDVFSAIGRCGKVGLQGLVLPEFFGDEWPIARSEFELKF